MAQDGFPTFPLFHGVSVAGNLSRDPYYSDKGKVPFASVPVVVNSRADSDEEQARAMYVDVKLYGKMAEFANDSLSKGRRVTFHGDLYLDFWTNDDDDEIDKFELRNVQSGGFDNRFYVSDDDDEPRSSSRGRGRSKPKDDDDEPRSTGRSRRASKSDDDEPEETPRRRRSTSDDDDEPRQGRRRRRVEDSGD